MVFHTNSFFEALSVFDALLPQQEYRKPHHILCIHHFFPSLHPLSSPTRLNIINISNLYHHEPNKANLRASATPSPPRHRTAFVKPIVLHSSGLSYHFRQPAFSSIHWKPTKLPFFPFFPSFPRFPLFPVFPDFPPFPRFPPSLKKRPRTARLCVRNYSRCGWILVWVDWDYGKK